MLTSAALKNFQKNAWYGGRRSRTHQRIAEIRHGWSDRYVTTYTLTFFFAVEFEPTSLFSQEIYSYFPIPITSKKLVSTRHWRFLPDGIRTVLYVFYSSKQHNNPPHSLSFPFFLIQLLARPAEFLFVPTCGRRNDRLLPERPTCPFIFFARCSIFELCSVTDDPLHRPWRHRTGSLHWTLQKSWLNTCIQRWMHGRRMPSLVKYVLQMYPF